jgi:uncharacterized phage protein (TIGR02218 family)
MKTASVAMTAHLAGNPTTLAWLWKVKRVDGTILGFTTHDQDLDYDAGDGDGSVTYLARSGFTNSAIASKSDLSVDNLEVTAFLDSESITEDDLRAHLYDDAIISILLVNWADLTMGHVTMKRAQLGIVKMQGGMGTAELRGLANKLTSQIGSTYGPLCRAELGSGLNGIDVNSQWKCMVDLALYRQEIALSTVPDDYTITINFPSPRLFMVGSATPTTAAPDGWFDNGVLKFTTGELAGQSFQVKRFLGGIDQTIKMFLPFEILPSPGDTFEIDPGCNKTIFDCQNKFANIVNFRGEPFMPGEKIYDYPDAT